MRTLVLIFILFISFHCFAEPGEITWVTNQEWDQLENFKNNKVLIIWDKKLYDSKQRNLFERHLEKKGYIVNAKDYSERSFANLEEYDQLWFFDSSTKVKSKTIVANKTLNLINIFLKNGKGLFIISNYNAKESATLLNGLFKSHTDMGNIRQYKEIKIGDEIGNSKAIQHEVLTGLKQVATPFKAANKLTHPDFTSIAKDQKNRPFLSAHKSKKMLFYGAASQLFASISNNPFALNCAKYLSSYRRLELKNLRISDDTIELPSISKFKNTYTYISNKEWGRIKKPKNNQILIVNNDPQPEPFLKGNLTQFGYKVTFKKYETTSFSNLENYHQIWLLYSDVHNFKFTNQKINYTNLKAFIENGKGAYIAGDDATCSFESSFLIESFYKSGFSNRAPETYKVKILKFKKFKEETLSAREHEIFTGIRTIHEGNSISRIEKSDDLISIGIGSEGDFICIPKDYNHNVIIDSGFTKVYPKSKNPKFIRNLALYLSGYRIKELKDEYQIEENY